MKPRRKMVAKYPGTCRGCGLEIKPGQHIEHAGRGVNYHSGCAPSCDPAGDREYWQGRRDVEEWHQNRALFGEAEAERMEIEKELREGWDY